MEILQEIKQAILNVEPEEEVYLFGSRARGTHSEDSDWDILVLLQDKVNYLRKEKIRNVLYDIQLKNELVFSIAIREKEFWGNNKVYQETEFYRNLIREMELL